MHVFVQVTCIDVRFPASDQTAAEVVISAYHSPSFIVSKLEMQGLSNLQKT